MGIGPFAVQRLIENEKAGVFRNKRNVLQLGRQDIGLVDMCNEFLASNDLKEITLASGIRNADIELFNSLGFLDVQSLDVSSYEFSSIVHDLNKPIPDEFKGKYDFVFDGGTIEHIFDIRMALENITHLLAEDGVVIHSSPMHNYVDHGFYSFSPTLFMDYYLVNKWEIESCSIHEQQRDGRVSWKWFKYETGILDDLTYGGFNSSIWGIWFIARKTSETTVGETPQQGYYSRMRSWSSGRR